MYPVPQTGCTCNQNTQKSMANYRYEVFVLNLMCSMFTYLNRV